MITAKEVMIDAIAAYVPQSLSELKTEVNRQATDKRPLSHVEIILAQDPDFHCVGDDAYTYRDWI